MSSSSTHEVPLSTIYLRIKKAGLDPLSVLGVGDNASPSDVRDAYRNLALRLHPDKASDARLRPLHTKLFQTVQDAYDQLQGALQDTEQSGGACKRLPETEAALHARNVEFREKLKDARGHALAAKKAEDTRKAEHQAMIAAKNARLARKRAARQAQEDAVKTGKQQLAAKRALDKHGGQAKIIEALKNKAEQPLADWEDEEDRLDAQDAYLKAKETVERDIASLNQRHVNHLKHQKGPTSASRTPMFDKALDTQLVSDKDIKRRFDKQLLRGGTDGSVSLGQRKQKAAHSGAAKLLRFEKAYLEEADRMMFPALTKGQSFSALEHEELLSAIVNEEFNIELRTDKELAKLESSVKQQHLYLEHGMGSQSTALAALMPDGDVRS